MGLADSSVVSLNPFLLRENRIRHEGQSNTKGERSVSPDLAKRINKLRTTTGRYGEAFTVRALADDEGDVYRIAVTLIADESGWEITGNPERLAATFRAIADRIDAIWSTESSTAPETP